MVSRYFLHSIPFKMFLLLHLLSIKSIESIDGSYRDETDLCLPQKKKKCPDFDLGSPILFWRPYLLYYMDILIVNFSSCIRRVASRHGRLWLSTHCYPLVLFFISHPTPCFAIYLHRLVRKVIFCSHLSLS